MGIELDDHQLEALEKMHNGCVLKGGVGSGKSRTALAYFCLKVAEGSLTINGEGPTENFLKPTDIYIITTAKKRDKLEWEAEALPFLLSTSRDSSLDEVLLTVDSWNNITEYVDVKDAFFIFDEQRLVGAGAWVKAFLKIAKHNEWIMLSATPGDTWMDYAPLFVANGFYKNRTDFMREHVVYSRFSRYPKIDRYIGQGRLVYYRNAILVEMPHEKHTIRHVEDLFLDYDHDLFERVYKDRWNIYEDRPIRDIAELFRVMRRLVNSDPSRVSKLEELISKHSRLIIFYNFNYELEILRTISQRTGIAVAEWNGQKHEEIPESAKWLYLVQYTAGAEGWNCTKTDAMVFYSLNYSYKITEQSKGRIDRMNTKFTDLHYYVFLTTSVIDKAIKKRLDNKQNFNEKQFEKEMIRVQEST